MTNNLPLNQAASCLGLHDFHLWVHLGDSPQEQFHAQKVSVSLKILFSQNPLAETNDQLQDTVCYVDLIQTLQDDVKKNHYQLIEKLCRQFYTLIKAMIPQDCRLQVKVHKLNPPIKDIYNRGVSYTCGDWID